MAERARTGADGIRDADGIRLLALTVPGLARLARRELTAIPGVRVTDDGNDGRADVLLFTAPRDAIPALRDLRTVEDVFIEVGRTQRSEGDRAGWISGRLWRHNRAEKAVSTWFAQSARAGRKGGQKSGGSGKMSYRVIVRVLHERSFHRTQLRDQLTKTVARDYPSWRVADPARLEIWALEYAAGRIVAGLRVSDASMRQRQGRTTERGGALRPAVAAAMVREVGLPEASALLDPCCGSGTILAEAKAMGWDVVGRDIDPGAIDAARENVKGADLATGDARRLDHADASVGACVSNLPFGRQYDVDEDKSTWLAAVLGEFARVTVPGGRIVLLAPAMPRAAIPAELRVRARHSLRLLGTKTTMWVIDRA